MSKDRQKIVAGNWKMHGDIESNSELLSDLTEAFAKEAPCTVIVFPPYPYIAQSALACYHTYVQWGAQDVSAYENGAYTGDVSAAMLHDLSCRYVIVGHSERRHVFGESNSIVVRKVLRALDAKVTPILCVGESEAERDSGRTEEIVFSQIDAVLQSDAGIEGLARCVIAYEPVWAIGTGKTATPEMANAVHAAIRHKLASVDKSVAENMTILYGGSVKPNNAAALFAMPDIDGGLIGGASLKANEFIEIISCIKSS